MAGWEQARKEAGRQGAAGEPAAGPCRGLAPEGPQGTLSQQLQRPDAGKAAPAQNFGASTADSSQNQHVNAR